MSVDYSPCGAFITKFTMFSASRNIRKCCVEDGEDFSGYKHLIVKSKVDPVSARRYDGGSLVLMNSS
jgi:hypothetical protein